MDTPMPNASMPTGSRNVPLAAPIRLIAAEKPTPLPRSSDGKISAGYTPVRSSEIALKNAKPTRQPSSTGTGPAAHTPVTSVVATITQNDVSSSRRRPTRSIATMPASAPRNAIAFVTMMLNFELTNPSEEKTSGANVKIAKYGATRHVKKMDAKAVVRHVSRKNRRRNDAGASDSSARSSSS
jgi:hypothetical protein